MQADADAIVAELALARGFVDAARLEQARRRLATLRQAGMPIDLLGALAPSLAPGQLAELRAAAAGGRAALDRPALAAATFAGARPAPPAPEPTDARAASAAGPAQPGDRIGPYEVVRELGRGAMGVVYEARHSALGRSVALKLQLAGGGRHGARFVREAQAAARLRHPGIVSVHEAGEDAGRLWMAMDLVAGESLERRLERTGPLPPEEAARLAAAVARALEHAHARGVLHRDLKPANILLDERGPRVTDFGLAKVVEGAQTLTNTGELLGTPAYMPPEQVNSGHADERSDVWSLGATLYHLLAGQAPFTGENLMATLARVLSANYAPLRQVRPDVPRALDAIVRRCLSRRPDQRYAGAGELAEDLERYLREGATDALARQRARGRRRAALVALVAFAALAVPLLALALAPRPSADLAASPRRSTPMAPSPASEVRPSAPVVSSAPEPPPPHEATAPGTLAQRPGEEFAQRGLWIPLRAPAGPGSPRPRARWSHAMAYDPRRRVVVVVGGRDKTEVFADQWAWDGATWQEETPPSLPGRRFSAAMAYDEARGRLVLHGGSDDRTLYDDVWEFDGARWTRVGRGGGPGRRGWHEMAYDPARRRVVMFGGADEAWKVHADLWTWDGAAWRELPAGPAAGPSGRHLFAMAWDARRDVLVVYGAHSGAASAEHWEWSPTAGWSQRPAPPPGESPGPRQDPGLVAAPGGLVLFGGFDQPRGYLQDTWRFDGERWTQLLADVPSSFLPSRRVWSGLVWDAGRSVVVMFGGERGRVASDETWELGP